MTAKLHLHILASGSKGNAAIVEGPQGSILIDCGLSRRSLTGRALELGINLDSVVGVLITHEHADHVSGLTVWCNSYDGELFTTAGTAASRRYLSGLPFTLVESDDSFEVAGIAVRTFPTSHDVADPMGFRFTSTTDGEVDTIGYCTDTGVLTPQAFEALANCRILALESNHDVRMLREGPYPAFLKQRVGGRTGHLSNDQAAEALGLLVGDTTETVVAMHLSEKNNRPSVCVRTLAAAFGAEQANTTFTEARTPDGHLSIVAAAQGRPLSIW